jgi:hypothetical protein
LITFAQNSASKKIKYFSKMSNAMTEKEFTSKIWDAKNDSIAYRFNIESLKILEDILLKKEFTRLEKYKVVLPQNAKYTEGVSEIPTGLESQKIPLQRSQTT